MTEAGLFTVGVFQDLAWAERGVAALQAQGFPAASLSVIAKDTSETAFFIQRTLGAATKLDVRGLGPAVARGPLVDALQGSEHDLSKSGIAATMRKVGFQAHDGRIFETLAGRGGVLVAVRSEARAADALATLHSYGGGNAAIGAWRGRV